ncbi:SAM-dependent methyltransferase [Roseivirga sp. BDSF3-8]|uniref:class I SAM-dependent methyltransferase n=1 Tax=Roseivirga sp. BDSF3-8 TaxID=3241598 RepID=UPI003532010B
MTELANKEVQDWLGAHENEQVTSLLLKGSPFPGIDARVLASQIEGRQKAKKKLPQWYEGRRGLLWPARISLEQCSSEATALYKASLVKGQRMADLTGGMGVDVFYMGHSFSESHYVEEQSALFDITRHNLTALGATTACHRGDGMAWLKDQATPFDLLYLDPARRDEHKQKVIRLQDYSPDITAYLPMLREKSDALLIKVSPMADLSELQRQIDLPIIFHVVAVDNECKEILLLIGNSSATGGVVTVNIAGGAEQIETFALAEEANTTFSLGLPESYLYEPNAAIMKAGVFRATANRYGLQKLHENSHLYTSGKLIADFPGRTFKINEVVSPTYKALKGVLPDLRGNLSTRNFPMRVEALKKKLRLNDGPDVFLFATTLVNGQKALLITEKA